MMEECDNRCVFNVNVSYKVLNWLTYKIHLIMALTLISMLMSDEILYFPQICYMTLPNGINILVILSV